MAVPSDHHPPQSVAHHHHQSTRIIVILGLVDEGTSVGVFRVDGMSGGTCGADDEGDLD